MRYEISWTQKVDHEKQDAHDPAMPEEMYGAAIMDGEDLTLADMTARVELMLREQPGAITNLSINLWG